MNFLSPFDDFAGEICVGAEAGGLDLVYRFRLDVAARVIASARGEGFQPLLMASDGDCFAGPVCGDDAGRLEQVLPPGPHSIIVDSVDDTGGVFVLDLQVLAP